MARPSPVASSGLVVAANTCPDAAGGQQHVAGLDLVELAVGVHRHARRRSGPPSTISSTANHRSHSAAAVARTSSTSARSISAPGGRTAGVHDPRHRVAALAGEQQAALAVAVEAGAHGDELVDPAGPSSTSTRTASTSHSPTPAAKRVGQVQVGGVRVAAEHGGDAALRPAGGGLVPARPS